ncbi:MAG TPA: hypothetical protein VLH08_05625, partial [Acidobacteriota bacterium]|nr:hypothetical protein [Acidobacteriota bacterium]
KYASENVVCSHYMVLKQIYYRGNLIHGITGDYPFRLPVAHPPLSITSQCIVVEYSSGELRAIDLTDCNDDILLCTLLENFTGAMVFQYNPDRIKQKAEFINSKLQKPPFTEPSKLHPGCYSTRGYYTVESDDVLQFDKYVTKENPKLYFRGLRTNAMRSSLQYLAKYPDAEVYENRIETVKYFAEFGSHKIALGLPGQGDLCFRDFEAFALKIPLLRPEYSVTLSKPLIPDFHYVKVNARNSNDMEMLAEDIMKRYYEVIQDQAFLEFIAKNAFEYYMNFGTYEKIAEQCFEFLQPTI